jgi:hypothetical protein
MGRVCQSGACSPWVYEWKALIYERIALVNELRTLPRWTIE